MIKRRLFETILIIFTIALLGLSCKPLAEPALERSIPAPDQPKSAKEPWVADWEKTIALAKKEGRVIVMGPVAPDVKKALQEAITAKYGIDMEMTIARSAEYVPKLQAERNRGIYSIDVILDGVSGGGFYLGPEGALQRLDAALILPEVVDPNVWYRGQLPFIDSNHFLFATQAIPKRPVAYNKDQVKPEQIGSYRDLLDPKWKGKIVFNDPTVAGAANTTFHALAEGIMSLDYLRQLGKQELVIIRDQRLQVEWLARGRYPILLGPKDDEAMAFITAGAPVMVMSPKAEPTFIVSSTTLLHLMNNPPHPNAAKLFINWFASKEGQTLLSRVSGGQSARLDVPTDHLPAFAVRQAGEKYFYTDTEESITKRGEYRSLAKEMWGHLMK